MNHYSRPFSRILFLVAISALCCYLMAPLAAATSSSETASGTDFEASLDTSFLGSFEEARQPDQPLLNVICDNPHLATVSYGSDEQYYCIWVTDEAGQRVDNLEVGDIYTVHLYLRASGPAGTSLKNLRIKWANEGEPIRIGIGCDVRYESTDGQKFYSSFNCLQLADSDIVKRPLVNTPVLLNSQEIDWSRLGGIAGGGDFPPVVIQELPVGQENAAEITFQFRAEDIADYADYFARPNETSSSTDSTEPLPSEPLPSVPKNFPTTVKSSNNQANAQTPNAAPDHDDTAAPAERLYTAADLYQLSISWFIGLILILICSFACGIFCERFRAAESQADTSDKTPEDPTPAPHQTPDAPHQDS